MSPVTRKLIPVWLSIPMFRYILSLVVGIILSYNFPGSFWDYLLWGSVVLIIAGLVLAYRFPEFFAISFFLFWISLGGMRYHHALSKNSPNFIGQVYKPGNLISVTLSETLAPKPKSWRSVGQVSMYDSSTRTWLPLSGKVILYFAKDSIDATLGPGSVLVIKKSLQPIKNSGNPGAFNYVSYAASNDWYYQVFLGHDEYLVSKKKLSPGWRIWPMRARNHLLQILHRNIPDAKSKGVAQALLTGYRNDMDKELSLQYAGTGVAHIIAISGLHLGIIQAGLLFFLTPLRRKEYGKRGMYLFAIIFLWVFAFVTGASASVLRAAFMFSMLLFGKVIGRRGNPYNTLCASAFFLLLFQPGLLFNVGFQLSYSAVLSIFLFSRPITNWVQTSNRVVHEIWSMVAVTLAAQILTLPFVLYYFHQFPVYFLLANIMAIPLVWLALNLCLLLTLIFWWLPPLASLLGKAIHLTIYTMNACIAWVDGLPLSRVENISISLPEAVLLMAILALMARWLLVSNKNAAVAAIALLSALFVYREWKWVKSCQQIKMVVYNIPGHSAIDFIKGNQTAFWGDSVCLQDPNLYRTHILPARILYQIDGTTVIPTDTATFLQLHFGGKSILLLDKVPDVKTSRPVKADFLILAAPIKLFPERLLQVVSADTIIADGKLPFYRIKDWQIAADSLPLHFHSTAENGAFVLDVKGMENNN
jgi:competence protein ComEC